MNEDKTVPVAVPDTTNLPPAGPRTNAAGGDQPADTVALAAERTVRDDDAKGVATDQSQLATADFPAAGSASERATQATLDLSSPAPISRPVRSTATVAPRQIGNYEILGELGRGGMGVVYKARHVQLGRIVALKMIRTGAHADADEIGRFLSEAQAVAKLQHPGIVQIFEIGQEAGLPYLSLELVDGDSLAARIAKEPLEPREAAELVEQLAQAMQYAHNQGILHRDLKPANVLLTLDGRPKITDFGLAKQLENLDSGATQTGTVLGTPSYMSPEQARGDVRELTSATDQYALGAVLYQLLTGRPPFLSAKAVETVLQVIHNEPVPPRQLVPKLPADLETICLKALAKDPQRRYASCTELADDLHRYLRGEPIVARPVGQVERAWRWCRRNPRVAIPTAASILLFLIAFGISVTAAWSLSKLNVDLKKQTVVANTQAGIAKANEIKARAAEQRAKDNLKVANDNAGVALNTIKQVLLEAQSGMGKTPALQPLKMRLIAAATNNLELLQDSIGTSGITGAATTLKYHELMSQLHRDAGEMDKAWQENSLAHELAKQRIEDQKKSTASRLNLASVCSEMAKLQREHLRNMHASLQFAQNAVELLEDVVANPKPPLSDPLRLEILAHQLAPARDRLGGLYVRLGKPKQALVHYEMAKEIRDALRRDPAFIRQSANVREQNDAFMRSEDARTFWAMGDVHYRLGDPEKGAACFDQVLAIYGEEHKRNPRSPDPRNRLLNAASQAGYWRFVSGKPEEARPLYAQSLGMAGGLATEYGNLVPIQQSIALVQYRMGVFLQTQGDPKAQQYFDACVKVRSRLAAADPTNDKREIELCLAMARAGQHASAGDVAYEILGRVKDHDIELQLDLARAYAQCAAADPSPAGAEAYRVNALYLLKAAVKQGHEDPVYLKTEPDYTPRRLLPEFQSLLTAEAPAAGKRP